MNVRSMLGTPSCSGALECFFELNELEVEAYKTLVKEGPLKVEELANRLMKDRSTAYRSLKTLMSSGLCFKSTKTIGRGGYYHVYLARPPSEVKQEILRLVDIWYDNMKQAAKEFDKFEGGKKAEKAMVRPKR